MGKSPDKRVSPNVILLSIVSFLNDLSSEMIMPILPMFLESLGAAGRVIGLVGGLRDSISSILKVLCGYWSDRTGKRKVFVYAGYITSTVFKMLLGFSNLWTSAVAFSSLERVGKGLRTAPRDAIIAESMTTQRGKGFGLHRAADSLGAILGSAAALLLFWFAGLRFGAIILIAAFLGFASLVPLWFVRESTVAPQKAKLTISLKTLPRPLKLFILVSTVFALGNFSYMFFILRAQNIFSGRDSIAAPIGLYILFNVFYSALAVPMGIISDKIGRTKVLVAGYFLFALTCLGFAFFDSLVPFIILFALYGLVFAATEGNQRAFVSDLAGGSLKATALGTYHTAVGLAALPASLIAGFLWEKASPLAAFIFGAAMAIASVLLFFALLPSFKGPPQSSAAASE